MNRRQLIQFLQQATGAWLVAGLLPGCSDDNIPFVLLRSPNRQDPLPEHLLTPVEEFYVQSYGLPPQVDGAKWRLAIAGEVEHPFELTLNEILAAPQESFHLTMECIGNAAGGDQIGNALWTGTPLHPFLQRAGVRPTAVEWVLHGADSYETTLPVAELFRRDVRLVHQMNQAPLTVAHGYPLRILIPGRYGQKQPKWLVKLEAIAQAKSGHWERRGWSNQAEIPTHALTQQVQNQRVWNRKAQAKLERRGDLGWQKGVLVAGVALDSSSPIQQIMVSTDNGQTWKAAEQNRPTSPHEWTLWRYLWQPDQAGTYTLLAYAVSQRQTQLLEDSNWRDGNSSVLKVQVTLEG